MRKPTTITPESVSEYRELIELRLRKRVLEAIEIVIEEESARPSRLACHNGSFVLCDLARIGELIRRRCFRDR